MKARTIVAGNWKMHTDLDEARKLMEALAGWSKAGRSDVQMIVAPPYPFLATAVDRASASAGTGRNSSIIIAAQNCHEEEQGAFTGEVSVRMLKSLGVDACIVGHSERRQYYGETDTIVGRKVALLLKHGLQPIYCCGERREEREDGRYRDVVSAQLHEALGALTPGEVAKVIVAYEPVWAIGTGLTATPEQAQEVHGFIRGELRLLAGEAASAIPILYGGSCKPENAAGIFAGSDINGGLIGGAALVADSFIDLMRIAQQVKSSS
ncbi:MAG: triose-phosphate isomerase [Flavobacteriales bacterium]|jgi:triosephosphate isomerase|nr:triose-phosphate isomerase [Flavobacteriales bacterium]